jgi:NAD+ kinase
VVICYHPAIAGARGMAETIAEQLRRDGCEPWVGPLGAEGAGEAELAKQAAGAALLVCVGGDGTVLRASEAASTAGTPIFGVRMGRLGFLTEATPPDAQAALSKVLAGAGRVEERALVQASIDGGEPLHALNDIVIGRRTLGRTVSVGASLDGVLVAEYRADAVIVATATGSTGYTLSIGGPVLTPTSSDLILMPLAPHLTSHNPLVLPGKTHISLEVVRGEQSVLVVDGEHEHPIESGQVVEVTGSPRRVRFARLGGEGQFYANVADRLGWLRSDHALGTERSARP